jgi:regulator of sigma E protease
MPLLAASLPTLSHAFIILVMVLGFGFVIFFHELGHFLAAKWVGIKVEQFAVGFGQALLAWRKGIGLRVGSTQREYRRKLDEYLEQHYKDDPQVLERSGLAYQQAMIEVEKASGLGETEYRLNWIPLGGYVKMLGQDDLRPNAEAEDPRSYNKKSIAARMLVVSAGVIMNVILAGIGFMVLFLIGFNVPPAWVGGVASGSPAQMAVKMVDGKAVGAPLRTGDQILSFGGKPQEDFTKIGLAVALSAEGEAQIVKVRRVDGSTDDLLIIPKADVYSNGFLSIGIHAPQLLRGLDPKDVDPEMLRKSRELSRPDAWAVLPGETIAQINGKDVQPTEFWKLDQALQDPAAHAVSLTVRDDKDQTTKHVTVDAHIEPMFGGAEADFAGMLMRPAIKGILPDSSTQGKLSPGDVVVSITTQGQSQDTKENIATQEFREILQRAGEDQKNITLVVLRDGQKVTVPDLSASAKIENGKVRSRGLGVALGYDEMHAVVAGKMKDSPADIAGIPVGATITAIGDDKVSSWFDVQRRLGAAQPDKPVSVSFTTSAGGIGKRDLHLSESDIERIRDLQRSSDLTLREYIIVRVAKAASGRRDPLLAAYWGVTETRDFILQFYMTLRRMAGGSVSPDQLMGPLGIFVGGARFGFKGWDWLLWFLSMISANLAVVNFLPIPIVDGGLFTFLLLEKIQGRPLSARTQAIAQYVGLAFLAGVFLFVTYHDILRFI